MITKNQSKFRNEKTNFIQNNKYKNFKLQK